MHTSNFKRVTIKQFFIKAVILYAGWLIIYHGYIIPDGRLNKFLTKTVIAGTTIGLNIFKYDTTSLNDTILIENEPVVLVADGCNGLELFVLFSGFIIAFPGKLRYKLVFIPFGIFMIYLINILREMALAINYKFFKETFEFNHYYTYVLIVYFFIFILWRFWLNNFSAIGKIPDAKVTNSKISK